MGAKLIDYLSIKFAGFDIDTKIELNIFGANDIFSCQKKNIYIYIYILYIKEKKRTIIDKDR